MCSDWNCQPPRMLLCRADGLVNVMVEDNGRGFDLNQILPGHFGVTIMRERAAKIGAALDVASQPGHGTNLTLIWKNEDI